MCAGELYEQGQGQSEGALTTMALTTSTRAGGALVIAAFCSGAPPTLDARSFTARCPEGDALLASTTLYVGGENHNPTLDDDQLHFEGDLWPTMETPSCSDAIPSVQLPWRTRTLGVTLREQDREPIDEGSVETLTLSSFVDDGVLERQYSVQEPGPLAPIELRWTPSPPAASEQLVHFVFVLRDGRGGTAFARRTVCVRVLPTERNQP